VKTQNCKCAFSTLALAGVLIVILLASNGCFWRKKQVAAAPAPSAFTVKTPAMSTNLVIAPAASAVGRVVSVRTDAKFVVISFPVGQVPAVNTRLSIFHAGQKSGEVNISGPSKEDLTVGDITSGSAQEGDDVRAE
jgi:hypothetical protein